MKPSVGSVVITFIGLAFVVASLVTRGPSWPTTLALPIIGVTLGSAFASRSREHDSDGP